MADSVFEPGKRGRGRRGGVVVAYLTGFSSLFDFSLQIKEDQAPAPPLDLPLVFKTDAEIGIIFREGVHEIGSVLKF